MKVTNDLNLSNKTNKTAIHVAMSQKQGFQLFIDQKTRNPDLTYLSFQVVTCNALYFVIPKQRNHKYIHRTCPVTTYYKHTLHYLEDISLISCAMSDSQTYFQRQLKRSLARRLFCYL